MLRDARGDERMRDLQQQRSRAGSEEEHRLTVQAPGFAGRAVQPAVDDVDSRERAGSGGARLRGRGSYRSPGRRPTNHHAAGNAAAASASLIASHTRNANRPLAMALLRSPPNAL